jgi:glutamate/aspartate transport system permease protein
MNLDWSFYSWSVLAPYLQKGLAFSVQLTIAATLGGMLLGTALALMRLSGSVALAWLAGAYVNTMRSIPLVMVILWFYLLAPYVLGPVGAEASALITFTLFEAAYFAEIMRAGITSVPRGQTDAARALGLSRPQMLRFVVLPQALRNMLPVLLTQTIVLFQDTSLVYAIGAYDLLKGFEVAGRNLGRPMEAYLAAAALYFTLCFALSRSVQLLQSRLGAPRARRA